MAEREIQNATARVTVQLEIKVSSNWGPECSVKQVHEQAASEAIGMVRNLSPQNATCFADAIRILGEPKVTAIIVTRGQEDIHHG